MRRLWRVEPINWIRSVRNFLPNEAKYTLWYTCLIISFDRRMWKSTFVPETIFRRSIRLEQTDRTCWTIQTHSDELNWARRRTFHEVNSISLVRLMKMSTFGLGLTVWFILWKVRSLFSLGITWNILNAIFRKRNEAQTCQKQRLCRWQRAYSKGTEEVVPACNSFLRSFHSLFHCYSTSTQK